MKSPSKKSTNVRTSVRTIRAFLRLLDRLSSRASGWLAERLFERPRRAPRPHHEGALLQSAETFQVDFDEYTLQGWEWGAGPTVLLVHGWEGRGSQLGPFVAPLTEAGFRVVTFDAPAHGASPGSHATLLDFGRAVRAVAARVAPVSGIVAHSLGAAATTIALARGLEVERAVYLAPLVRVAGALDRFARFLGLSPEATAAFHREIEHRANGSVASIEGEALARGMDVPLLVVHDEDDREVPLSDSERLVATWPLARLHRTQGLGHRRLLQTKSIVKEGVSFFAPMGSSHVSPMHELDRELYDREARRERAFPTKWLARPHPVRFQ